MWKRELPAHELRTRYIFAHSVGQQAIARVVRAALDQRPDDWEGIVHSGFSQIPWGHRHRLGRRGYDGRHARQPQPERQANCSRSLRRGLVSN